METKLNEHIRPVTDLLSAVFVCVLCCTFLEGTKREQIYSYQLLKKGYHRARSWKSDLKD